MNRVLLLLGLALRKTSKEIADIILDTKDSGPYLRGMLIALLGFGLGLGMILKPYAFWKFKWSWRLKYGEPSNVALWSIRITGVILLLVSVILFFISLFNN